MDTRCDVLIIGAGPAGSVASTYLARQGRDVLCLERAYFPRYVIGESLLPRCNAIMAEVGLLDAVAAQGFMIKRGARFWRGEQTARFDFARGLPGDLPSTFQTPRAHLDQTLATGARDAGARLRFGTEVRSLEFDAKGVLANAVDLDTEEALTIRARFLIDCSGYGRVLPRMLDLEGEPCLSPRVALFTMVEGDQRPGGDDHGDIWAAITERGWSWFIPFADGRTSVGSIAPPDALPQASSDRERLFAMLRSEPRGYERMINAEPVMNTMRLQAWTRSVSTLHGQGWAIAGNAGEFLDPIFSSGVTLAMESSLLAAKLSHVQLDGENVDWAVNYEQVLRRATGVFKAFVEAWYTGTLPEILFSPGRSDNIHRSIVSILAGYVLNEKNSLVRNPEKGLRTLLEVLRRQQLDPAAAATR